MLKAIIFDLDETLLDWRGKSVSWEDHYNHHLGLLFEYVQQNLHPLQDRAAFTGAVYTEVTAAWSEARHTNQAPHFGDILLESLSNLGVPAQRLDREECLQAFRYAPMPGIKPFADVIPELENLRSLGLRLGLVTNSMHPMHLRDRELEATGLLPFFEDTASRISAADVGFLKPDARIFHHALQVLGIATEEAVFVGDNLEADILGAQGVGIKAVLRHNDDTPPPNGIVPDGVIRNLHELHPLLDAWFGDWRR